MTRDPSDATPTPDHRTATAATPPTHLLAEGPLWDAAHSRLLWVDIHAGDVHAGVLEESGITTTRTWHVDRTVGAVAPAADGRLLVAGRDRLWVVEADGHLTEGPSVLPAGATRRLNDGACDPAGRFLVGSLSLGDPTGREVLCRLEDDGTFTMLDDDLGLSNGLGWSPDGGTLYSVDTLAGVVHARDYDVATGRTGPRRTHLHLPGSLPDGLAVDEAGDLWIAVFGAGEVRCYAADGTLRHTVDVPAPHTTSVAFAGPDRRTLVITTGKVELDDAGRAAHPASGSLFLAQAEAPGLARTPWNGQGVDVRAGRTED